MIVDFVTVCWDIRCRRVGRGRDGVAAGGRARARAGLVNGVSQLR